MKTVGPTLLQEARSVNLGFDVIVYRTQTDIREPASMVGVAIMLIYVTHLNHCMVNNTLVMENIEMFILIIIYYVISMRPISILKCVDQILVITAIRTTPTLLRNAAKHVDLVV